MKLPPPRSPRPDDLDSSGPSEPPASKIEILPQHKLGLLRALARARKQQPEDTKDSLPSATSVSLVEKKAEEKAQNEKDKEAVSREEDGRDEAERENTDAPKGNREPQHTGYSSSEEALAEEEKEPLDETAPKPKNKFRVHRSFLDSSDEETQDARDLPHEPVPYDYEEKPEEATNEKGHKEFRPHHSMAAHVVPPHARLTASRATTDSSAPLPQSESANAAKQQKKKEKTLAMSKTDINLVASHGDKNMEEMLHSPTSMKESSRKQTNNSRTRSESTEKSDKSDKGTRHTPREKRSTSKHHDPLDSSEELHQHLRRKDKSHKKKSKSPKSSSEEFLHDHSHQHGEKRYRHEHRRREHHEHSHDDDALEDLHAPKHHSHRKHHHHHDRDVGAHVKGHHKVHKHEKHLARSDVEMRSERVAMYQTVQNIPDGKFAVTKEPANSERELTSESTWTQMSSHLQDGISHKSEGKYGTPAKQEKKKFFDILLQDQRKRRPVKRDYSWNDVVVDYNQYEVSIHGSSSSDSGLKHTPRKHRTLKRRDDFSTGELVSGAKYHLRTINPAPPTWGQSLNTLPFVK